MCYILSYTVCRLLHKIILTVIKIRPNTINDTVLKDTVTNAKGRTVRVTSPAYLKSCLKYFILYVIFYLFLIFKYM